MTVRIEVEPQAVAQLDELDAWWREHRPDSRTSVLDEFGHPIAALREQPGTGVPHERGAVRDVRWVRLRGTPYKVYYHHEPGGEVLSVVAVWSVMRGVAPSMGE